MNQERQPARLPGRVSWRSARAYARGVAVWAVLGILAGNGGPGTGLEAGGGAFRTKGSHLGPDLRGADLRGADLQGADLQEAQLQGANLQGAGLQGADLEKAQLQKASLQGANLQEANLEGANLQEAFLWQANLQGAQLQGADLTGAIGLTIAQIEAATTDEKTRLPDYLRPPARPKPPAQ